MQQARFAIAIAACLLVGCAAISPEEEHARIRAAIASASRETQACYARLASEPHYAPLRAKVAVSSSAPPTIDQLRDLEHPSSDMIQLGLAWYSENQKCDSATVEKWGRVDPELGVAVAGWVTETTEIMQAVIRVRPTYAEINARIKRLRERQRADIRGYYADLEPRIRRQQAAERAAAEQKSEETKRQFSAAIGTFGEVVAATLVVAVEVLAIRQAALAQSQARYVREVPSYQPSKITTTNCYYVGNLLQCTQVTY